MFYLKCVSLNAAPTRKHEAGFVGNLRILEIPSI
jgi:hypothetical protein